MMRIRKLGLASLLLATATLAMAEAKPVETKPPAEATIPFANRGGVSDWRVVDDSTVLISDIHGHWYRAKLLTPARGLHFSDDVGFETLPSGALGKHASIVIEGQRHPIISLTRTPAPAKPAR